MARTSAFSDEPTPYDCPCKELRDAFAVVAKFSNLIERIYGSVKDDRSAYINELLAEASHLERRIQMFLANTGTVQRAGADGPPSEKSR